MLVILSAENSDVSSRLRGQAAALACTRLVLHCDETRQEEQTFGTMMYIYMYNYARERGPIESS